MGQPEHDPKPRKHNLGRQRKKTAILSFSETIVGPPNSMPFVTWLLKLHVSFLAEYKHLNKK